MMPAVSMEVMPIVPLILQPLLQIMAVRLPSILCPLPWKAFLTTYTFMQVPILPGICSIRGTYMVVCRVWPIQAIAVVFPCSVLLTGALHTMGGLPSFRVMRAAIILMRGVTEVREVISVCRLILPQHTQLQ